MLTENDFTKILLLIKGELMMLESLKKENSQEYYDLKVLQEKLMNDKNRI